MNANGNVKTSSTTTDGISTATGSAAASGTAQSDVNAKQGFETNIGWNGATSKATANVKGTLGVKVARYYWHISFLAFAVDILLLPEEPQCCIFLSLIFFPAQ